MVNIFLAFFFRRPTDLTLANHIDEKRKNKWGWPNELRAKTLNILCKHDTISDRNVSRGESKAIIVHFTVPEK